MFDLGIQGKKVGEHDLQILILLTVQSVVLSAKIGKSGARAGFGGWEETGVQEDRKNQDQFKI